MGVIVLKLFGRKEIIFAKMVQLVLSCFSCLGCALVAGVKN
jgi:hypothetical protein